MALPSTSSLPSSGHDGHGLATAQVLNAFTYNMMYNSPKMASTNEELEAYMYPEMLAHNLPSTLEKTLHLAASLIELGYHECTFEEKKTIALYNWYLIYVDDVSSRDVNPFVEFEQRFLRGQRQLDPVLDALTLVLFRIYDQYDTSMANYILSATFDFVNSTCMEPEIEALPLVRGTVRFPWFLRDRTGVAVSFSLLLYPKTKGIHMRDVLHALPDMNFWVSGTNDLLSFHKEEIAGETANYIHNRSFIEERPLGDVLRDLEHELHTSRQGVLAALENSPQQARSAWRTWEIGYVAWHLSQKRYMLEDLGLSP